MAKKESKQEEKQEGLEHEKAVEKDRAACLKAMEKK